jgi:hypothetical protein
MHTDIPFITVAVIGVGVTTGRVMLFKYADLPAKVAQQCCRGQAANARTNDDGIIRSIEAV